MKRKKIGNFISQKRKEKNLTQQSLGEILGVTDRTIINWEKGRCLPDYSILIPLCENLDITIDELINDEKQMREMKKVLNELSVPNSASLIYKEIRKIIDRK